LPLVAPRPESQAKIEQVLAGAGLTQSAAAS
jgi:hypothetical protein